VPSKAQEGGVLANIKKLEQERNDRRLKFEEIKQAKIDKAIANRAAGKVVDCDYDEMIEHERT
jgi:hypothetical protein